MSLLCGLATVRNPDTLEMDLTSRLTLVSDGKPFVQASRKAERRALDLASTNSIVIGDVFIKYFNPHIVSDVLDVKLISLVPHGSLSCVILNSSLVSFLSVLDDTEGVHFAKELSITS